MGTYVKKEKTSTLSYKIISLCISGRGQEIKNISVLIVSKRETCCEGSKIPE
jgi:hypothetical protein